MLHCQIGLRLRPQSYDHKLRTVVVNNRYTTTRSITGRILNILFLLLSWKENFINTPSLLKFYKSHFGLCIPFVNHSQTIVMTHIILEVLIPILISHFVKLLDYIHSQKQRLLYIKF